MESWLRMALVRFARGRGGVTLCVSVCCLGSVFRRLDHSQNKIGWKRFMEGMIFKVAVEIQQAHYNLFQFKEASGRWGLKG